MQKFASIVLISIWLTASSLGAQRADRSSDLRDRGRTGSVGSTGRASAPVGPQDSSRFSLLTLTSESEPRYSFDLNPQAQVQARQVQIGVALSFNNDSLISLIPFQLTVKDRLVSEGGSRHNLFQADGYAIAFSRDYGVRNISVLVLGLAKNEAGVATSQEAELEFDAKVYNDTIKKRSLVGSYLQYWDHKTLAGGGDTSGPTTGFSGQATLRSLQLTFEYDLNSDFGEGDYYIATVQWKIERGNKTFVPFVTNEKGSLFRMGLKLNSPEERHSPVTRGP